MFNDGTKAGEEDPLNIALLGAENARLGLPQPELDPHGVYSVQFTLGPKLPADVWIDDVAFVVR